MLRIIFYGILFKKYIKKVVVIIFFSSLFYGFSLGGGSKLSYLAFGFCMRFWRFRLLKFENKMPVRCIATFFLCLRLFSYSISPYKVFSHIKDDISIIPFLIILSVVSLICWHKKLKEKFVTVSYKK